jgi:hypothetical protein
VVAPVYPTAVTITNNSANIAISFNTVPTRNYTVEYKTNLADANWSTLTSLTAVDTNSLATDPLVAPQRYYRVGSSIPVVSEP